MFRLALLFAILPTNDALQHRSIGIDRAKAGEIEAALAELDAALMLEPRDAETQRWRGHCLNLLGSYRLALDAYAHASEIEPNDPWTHYASGMAHHNLGELDLAIDCYSRAIEIDPSVAKPWQWRGFVHAMRKEYELALFDLDHALLLESDNARVWASRAKVRFSLREFTGARNDFEAVLALEPNDFEARMSLSIIDVAEDREHDALECWNVQCSDPAQQQTYPRMWKSIVRARSDGSPTAARAELAQWIADSAQAADWELRAVTFLLGEGDCADFLAAAADEEHARAGPPLFGDDMRCEALFYAAARCEIEGDARGAPELYERCLAEDARDKWERELARVAYAHIAQKLGFPADSGLFLADGNRCDGRDTRLIESVRQGSLAEACGLVAGDVLCGPCAAPGMLEALEPGAIVALDVERADDESRARRTLWMIVAAARR